MFRSLNAAQFDLSLDPKTAREWSRWGARDIDGQAREGSGRRLWERKMARTTDDLGLMPEDAFLDVLQKISVLGKNVKQELKDTCLKLRNASGHPNSLAIGENRVAAQRLREVHPRR